jgi:hypothetical protein
MSNRNGDKARHNRLRKQKIRRRRAFAALREKSATEKPPRKSAKSVTK